MFFENILKRRETRHRVDMANDDVQWEKFYFINPWVNDILSVLFFLVTLGLEKITFPKIMQPRMWRMFEWTSNVWHTNTWAHEQEKNISGPEPVMLTVAGAGACATMNLCHACRAELLQVFFEGKSKIFYGKYDVLKTSCVWITFFIHSLPDFKKIWKNSWLFPSLV